MFETSVILARVRNISSPVGTRKCIICLTLNFSSKQQSSFGFHEMSTASSNETTTHTHTHTHTHVYKVYICVCVCVCACVRVCVCARAHARTRVCGIVFLYVCGRAKKSQR